MVRRRASAHLKWASLILLFSQCLAEDPFKVNPKNWAENTAENFPKSAASGEYFFEEVPLDGKVAEVKPFQFDEVHQKEGIVSEVTLDYKLWLHQEKLVNDVNDEQVIDRKITDFQPKRLKGTLDTIKDYFLRSFGAFSYAIQGLKAKFTEEKTYSEEGLKVFHEFPLTFENSDKKPLNMRPFVLSPIQPAVDDAKVPIPEAVEELKKITLKLYIRLGNQQGLIAIGNWKVTEEKTVTPYDHFMLNVVQSSLIAVAESDKQIEFLNNQQKVKDLSFPTEQTAPALPAIETPTKTGTKFEANKWYYYNKMFNYPLIVADGSMDKDIFICDVASNCFRYDTVTSIKDETPVTPPNPPKPNKAKYELDQKLRALLGNTPFVRFSFSAADAGKIDFEEDFIKKQIIDNVAKKSISLRQLRPTFTKGVEKSITVPLDFIDVRFMQVEGFVECDNPVKVLSAQMGEHKIDLSFLPATKTPYFRTQDFFFAEKTDVRELQDVILTATTDSETAQCSVIHMDPKKPKIEFKETDIKKEFAPAKTIDAVMKDNRVLIQSDWIRVPDDINVKDNVISAEFTIMSEKPLTNAMKEKIIVRRALIGRDYYAVSDKDTGPIVTFDETDPKKINIKEDTQTLPQTSIGSAIRFAYFVQFPGNIPDPKPESVSLDMFDSQDGVAFDEGEQQNNPQNKDKDLTQADKDAAQKAEEEKQKKAKEEADKKAKEDADKKTKEEADKKAKEEADKKAKEEADKKAKEDAEKNNGQKTPEQIEAEKKAKEEADKKAKEEADKKAKEEADKKAKEEADKKAKEEADKKTQEEAEKKAKEEADKKAKEEADKLKAKEEDEKKAREEAAAKELARNSYKYTLTISIKGYKQDDKAVKSCGENALTHQDCNFETTKCLSTFKLAESHCAMEKFYINRVEECEKESCSNFLRKPISKSNIFAGTDEELRRFYPLNSPNKEGSSLQFSFAASPDRDSCIGFNYLAIKHPLLLHLDGTDTLVPLAIGEDEVYKMICSSEYTPTPEKVSGFTFAVPDAEANFENIADHYVTLESLDFSQAIKTGDYLVSEAVHDGEIQIFADDSDVFNDFDDKITITTKWILNRNAQVRYGFKFQFGKDETLNYTARIINDKHLYEQEGVVDSADIESNKWYQKELAVQSPIYKVEFTFIPKGMAHLTEVYFNDPCRLADSTLFCGHPKSNPTREEYKVCKCEPCDNEHSGPRCDVRDYCVSGGYDKCFEQVGKKEACHNEPELLSYRCDDCKDSEWDFTNTRCMKKPAECKETEMFVVAPNGDITCDCKPGFFRKEKDCIQFEVCNNDHRLAQRGGSKFDCSPNSHCEPTGKKDEIKLSEYKCVCNAEYFNTKGISERGNTRCRLANVTLDVLSCPQGFRTNNNECNCIAGYDKKDTLCEPGAKTTELIEKLNCRSAERVQPFIVGGECVCQSGFKWNKTTHVCDIDLKSTRFVESLNCKSGKIEIDDEGKIRCACAIEDHLRLNPITRVCEEDYEKEIQECKAKHNGVFDQKVSKKCECSPTEIMYQKSADDAEEWQCVDRCAVLNRISDGKFKCSKAFSSCDRKDIVFKLTEVELADKTKVQRFIEGKSDVTSKNEVSGRTALNIQASTHCHCLDNFELNMGSCQQTSNVALVKVTMNLKRDPQDVIVIGKNLDNVLAQILKGSTKDTTVAPKSECKVSEADEEVVICESSFAAGSFGDKEITPESVRKLIERKSVDLGNGLRGIVLKLTPRFRRSLFFDQQPTGQANGGPIFIQLKPETIMVNKVDLCGQDPCREFPNSVCSIVEKSNFVQCTCPADFERDRSRPNANREQDNFKITYEPCKVKDLCSDPEHMCKDNKNTYCETLLRKNGTSSFAEVLCTCKNTGVRLLSKNNECGDCDTCNKEGTAFCGYAAGKQGVCKCKDNFKGEKCEKPIGPGETGTTGDNKNKDSEDGKVSKAYIYTTIAAGIVAVLAIVGVCVLFYRRR